MNHFDAELRSIALKQSIPFCYGCYRRALSGRCNICGTDDLMREYPGTGVEYGTDWIIAEILRENLSPVDADQAFEDYVSDCHPDPVKIGWIECDIATAIKQLDPLSWRLALDEWLDSALEDGTIYSFNGCSAYYWTHEVERLAGELCTQ